MPFEYPASVRRGLSDRMRQGEAVLAVHAESGICLGTLYRWKYQALVDAGLAAGTPSTQAPDLQSAAKRIRQLEEELAIVKAASALYDEQVVAPPKQVRDCRRARRPGLLGQTCLPHHHPEPFDLH